MTFNSLPLLPLRLVLVAGTLAAFSSLAIAQETNPVKLVKGVVTDSQSGQPIKGGKVAAYAGSSSEATATSGINPGTGEYQMILSPSTSYRIVIKSPHFLTSQAQMMTPGGSNYEETVRNLTVDPVPIGSSFYSGQLFDKGSSALRVTPELEKVTAMLHDMPTIKFKVGLLADAAGAAPAGKPRKGKKGATVAPAAPSSSGLDPALYQARTDAIRDFLRKEHISTTRVDFQNGSSVGAKSSSDNAVFVFSGIDESEGEDS